MKGFKKFEKNKEGKDYVIGDIHGNYSALELLLSKVGFNKKIDRLFSVGDLVDRGIENHKSLEYLGYSWFHAIAGNHEYVLINASTKTYEECYPKGKKNVNGNEWFFLLDNPARLKYIKAFKDLPIAIQVGDVGLVHAWSYPTWKETVKLAKKFDEAGLDKMTRSRTDAYKVKNGGSIDKVKGIEHVIVGHTIFDKPVYSGNTLFLDTGYYEDEGTLSIVELGSMKISSVSKIGGDVRSLT